MTDYPNVYRRCCCTDPTTRRRSSRNCPLLAADPGHGSWYFAVQVTNQQGRPQRLRRGGFRTAAEAADARQAIAGQDPGLSRDGGLTVAAWLRAWVDTLPRRVRPSTAASYTAHVTNILIPALGGVRLGALTRDQVQTLFDDLAKRRNRYGVPITATTLQRIRATLRRALNAAIARRLIAENPAPPPRPTIPTPAPTGGLVAAPGTGPATRRPPPTGHVDGLASTSSARNRFTGLVTAIKKDTVMAQVEIQSGPHRIVSLMSRDALDDLGLRVGCLAVAVVKSTTVIVEKPHHD